MDVAENIKLGLTLESFRAVGQLSSACLAALDDPELGALLDATEFWIDCLVTDLSERIEQLESKGERDGK